ncbi:putative LIM and calponin domains-containing protein 1 [Cucumis melo var. makuwa]|uniref:LIM and calponin domains-containing protein 1 n=2 Tax=Cucumis melo TaxID=3656 RepID=A0A5D3DK86_CUCMM|nr:putative LIM and calponin domains-containing protein 1 [Cucumis melo var. makuwa]TYK24081.1 putative LIM and calponin domains-containing protein 1 [Cucumis melo var. makuwa]
MMNKFKKSEILVLLGLTILLVITPLLSSSLRPTYLYFIFNLLIIALGVQAGLLNDPPPDHQDKTNKLSLTSPETVASSTETSPLKKHRALEKAHSDKISSGNVKMESLKKCPSASSIFYIGEGDSEAEETTGIEDMEEEVVGGGGNNNGQELFAQAETFIGNFYKQLKMQKEESWKNIHGFYQKRF